MAITFVSGPDPFFPVCNETNWVFESDETAQPNFSFIVELYMSGILQSTHEVYPESGIAGKFSPTGIARAAVSSNFPDASVLSQNLNPDLYWDVIVYEKYGTPPVIDLGSATSAPAVVYYLNGSFRYGELHPNIYDYQDYDLDTGGKGDLFLTDFPRNRRDLVSYYESKFLSIINSGTDNCTGYVSLYDISGSLITSATWIGALGTNLRTPMISCGPRELVGGTSLVQSDFDDCYYYTIQIKQTATPSKDSEIYKIYYDTSCSAYPRRRLHWLNKFGAWDSFTFTLLSEDSTDITSNKYSRQTGRWVGSAYQYDLSDGQQMTMSKFMQDKLILNSDWIQEDVQQWLVRELYESPRVYLQNDFGTDILEPVNVTNANYILKQRRKAGLIQELVQIDRTYTKISQLG
jgi:hypothetical protein